MTHSEIAEELPPGTIVAGRFRVLSKDHEDPRGVLLRAEDTKTQKPVALRVLRPGLLDEAGMQKLKQHCRKAAMVRHKGVAAVYGVGSTPGGATFVASEWVDGTPLSEAIHKRAAEGSSSPLRGIYRVVANVAQALSAVHTKDIHGAVRPEAVLVTHDGHVKLVDLGLGLPLVSAVGPEAFPSAEQASLAPEVKVGAAPSAASDVFGLGAILYQLLTSSSPADGFTPPSQAHPEASEAIDQVLLTSLAMEPAERYPSPEAFVAALKPLVISAPPDDGHEGFGADVDIDIDIDLQSTPPPPSAGPPVQIPPPAKLPGRPAPPPPRRSEPQVGQRVSLADGFRPAEGGQGSSSLVDLSSVVAKITENDAPRWMVSKDGLDHGPFSGRELVKMVVAGEVLGQHQLMNMDTGARRPVREWSELTEFLEQQKLHFQDKARREALDEADRGESRSSKLKIVVGASVIGLVAVAMLAFVLTRRAREERQVAEADLGDLLERGEIAIEGTAGILEDPAPRRSGMGMGGGGMASAGGFAGSYEEAMSQVIEVGDITMNGGQRRLSPDQVASVMNRHVNRLYSRCVVPEQGRGGRLSDVTIDIAIAGSGQVMGVSARQGSGTFKSCIRAQVRAVRFPSFQAPRMGARYGFSAS